MDDEFLKNCIDNGYENEFLDYKLDIYNFGKENNKGKEDFLTDVLAMANSNYADDKYIITGEKVRPYGKRIKKGIDLNIVKDSADYQQIVSENIEPAISIEFQIIEYKSIKYGIFKISNCTNRPYLLKKDYMSLRAGFMKIRHGSRNDKITRFDLDNIYKSKKVEEKTDFKIYGINEGKLTEKIVLKKYRLFDQFSDKPKVIQDKIEEINNFIIDDIPADDEKIGAYINSINSINKSFFAEERVKLVDEDIKYINNYIEEFEININENFFDIGNVTKKSEGFTSWNMMIVPKYKIYGSDKSLKKYNSIKELNNMISYFIHMKEFEKKLNSIYYLELAIIEVGNIPDEEVEVNLIFPKNAYIDIEEFPKVHKCIKNIINELYARKLFQPEYNNEISDCRKVELPSLPITSNIYSHFQESAESEYESIDEIYEFIDYDISNKNNETILKFTIKNIKVNEAMVFPGNIILKNKIDRIEYFIISKKSKKTITGQILIDM